VIVRVVRVGLLKSCFNKMMIYFKLYVLPFRFPSWLVPHFQPYSFLPHFDVAHFQPSHTEGQRQRVACMDRSSDNKIKNS